jgi:hypothetical protein
MMVKRNVQGKRRLTQTFFLPFLFFPFYLFIYFRGNFSSPP